MRAVIYTGKSFLELGIIAKDSFLSLLNPDKDGCYDAVVTMTQDLKDSISKLTDKDFGMDWNKERSYIAAFKEKINEVENGEKILITDHWAGAPHYMDVVVLINEGMTISEAADIVRLKIEKLVEAES